MTDSKPEKKPSENEARLLRVAAKLKKIRERKDLKLKPTPHLKTTFTDFDGSERELKIRYYQVQGILHLIFMKRFILGDDTGLGKTLQSIAALCYIWEKDPSRKAIVLTTKSATPQWAKEFGKFTKGVRVITAAGTRAQREKAYAAWRRSDKPTVMIMGYRSAVNDIRKLQDDEGYVLITDEATAYKNQKTQIHQVVGWMGQQADRVWGLTATLIKNHLMEGHGIYSVVVPGLFGTANNFMQYYCIVERMMIGRGRKVNRVVGYFPDKVVEFRERIAPYYLGRPKHDVASELPILIRKVVDVGCSKQQASKYREALTGFLTVGETRTSGDAEEKEVTKLTAISYCQQIVNHPSLIECGGGSSKMDALIEMLTTGDLADDKVIVFSRFKKMVDILMPALEKAKLHPVRVTGDESGDQRQANQDTSQDPNSNTRVICLRQRAGRRSTSRRPRL